MLVGAMFVGMIALCALKRYNVEKSAFGILVAWLLLTTTVHPWYLLWVLPFLCWRNSAALHYWTWSVGLAYFAKFSLIRTGLWVESRPLWLLEYVPVALLGAWELAVYLKSRTHRSDAEPIAD